MQVPWLTVLVAVGSTALLGAATAAGVAIKRRRTVLKPRPPREDVYA
jgi:hypothetical protein